MKHLLIIAIAILCCTTVHAQWHIGPKLSIGTITQTEQSFRILPNSDHGLYDLDFVGGTTVHSIGLMAYRNMGPFFLQGEVLATTYGMEYRMDNYNKVSTSSPVYTDKHYVLEIPFVAGILVKKNFKLGIGPVAEILVDKDSQFSDLEYYQNTSKNVELGFQALAGYQRGIIHVDLKYINKFSGIADGFNFGDDDMKLNKSANRISLSVGFAF